MGLRADKAEKKIRDLAKEVYKELYPNETLTVNFGQGKYMDDMVAHAEIDDIINNPAITFNLSHIHDKDYKYIIIHEISHIIHLRSIGYNKMDKLETLLICFDYHNPDWREIYYDLARKFGLIFGNVQKDCNCSREYEIDISDNWRKFLSESDEWLTYQLRYQRAYIRECKMLDNGTIASYDERVRMGNGGLGCTY